MFWTDLVSALLSQSPPSPTVTLIKSEPRGEIFLETRLEISSHLLSPKITLSNLKSLHALSKSRPLPHFDPNHSLCLCLEFVPASILSIFQSEIVIFPIVKLRDRGCDQFGCLGQTAGDILPLKTPTPGNKNHRKNNKISGK